MKGHLTYVGIAAGVVMVGLLLFGVNVTEALFWAFVLACPVMMVVMLFTMGRDHGGSATEQQERGPETKTGQRPESVASTTVVRGVPSADRMGDWR